jgi:hypothetical protein
MPCIAKIGKSSIAMRLAKFKASSTKTSSKHNDPPKHSNASSPTWRLKMENIAAPITKEEALAEYLRVEADARAECKRVHAAAEAEYDRVTADAWAKYNRTLATARAKA